MENLINILSTMRQHNSEGERDFIEDYIYPLNPTPFFNEKQEVIAYVVENTHGHSKVLWSCHVDTMHRARTSGDARQEVWVSDDGVAFVNADCDCLGADDGAGAWLMMEMIKADVAGTYIFHRGEEIGCWGSSAMALHHTDWLATFTHAIAFDRRGTTSIITHQRGERACSDELGTTLINLFGMRHELDPTGVYTDTAEYMDIIPECVNISIGYENEHGSSETLDTVYALALRDAVCALDWGSITLPVVRDPLVREYTQSKYGFGYGSYGNWGSTSKKATLSTGLNPYEIPTTDELLECTNTDLADWVLAADPYEVAFLLQDMADQLLEAQHGASYAEIETYDEHDPYNRLDVGMR